MSQAAVHAAYKALQAGELARARQHLSGQHEPLALHLAALVEKRAGNHSDAAELFVRAVRADPANPEIANNQGLNARAMGDHAGAVEAFQRALELKPDFASARQSLSRSLLALERWQEAERQARKLLAASPGETGARYTLASARLEQGDAESADDLLSQLISQGQGAAQIHFVRGRARLEMDRLAEGLDDLRKAHAEAPDALTLRTLAGACWMRGDMAAFHDLLSAAPSGLGVAVADILRQSGDLDAALAAWERLPVDIRETSEALRVKSTIHQEQGRAGEALEAAGRAVSLEPGNLLAIDQMATAQLMAGRAHDALATARGMRARQPLAQNWIALEATALRQLGSRGYRDLVRLDEHVQVFSLPVPDGFESIEAFNGEFIAALDRHRPYSVHPLNQSLRQGSQTARSLTSMRDPVVAAYIRALDGPIRAYMDAIGRDPSHPLTARNTGSYRIAGCWSVRLGAGGRHVDHIHPQGWISSAYYASVPEETARGEGRAGWIRFAQPPFRCEPALPAEKWIRPQAGMLVLFPSFLWHGTAPISQGAVRVTAPFDVVPS